MDKAGTFDIFTVLGHDLKSPLNAVDQYLQIIRDKMLGDTIDPYLEVVERSLARLNQMRELISDVTDWAKIQASTTPRSLAVVDLSSAARAVLDGYQNEAKKREIIMSSEIEDGLTMLASAWEIDLILRHLISNAIRYNRAGGAVVFRMRKAGPQILVDISDTGIGMSAEEQGQLFREFGRIKNRDTQSIKGTGLGLVIVKELLRRYQGTIAVESSPGQGTTFSLRLACAD